MIKENEINYISGFGTSVIDEIHITDLESSKLLKSLCFDLPTYYYWLDRDLSYLKKGIYRVKHNKRRMIHNNYDDFIYSSESKEQVVKFLNKYNKN